MTPQELKNSILQLAIQGKLVEQREEEGNAEDLYTQIQAEKQRLIAEKKIKKQKPLPAITDEDIPFEIPESWKWVRWGNLSESIQYGFNAPAKSYGRIKMVRISDIQDGKVLWDSVPFCSIQEEEIPNYLLEKNDILFARTGGTVGKSYLVREIPGEAIYAGYLIRTRYSKSLCPEYMKYFMESSLYWRQLKNGTIATAQPNCNGKTLAKMLIPLPPLAEQQRIVAKIEELLPHIDRYEQAWSKLEQFNARFPEDMKKSLLQYAIQGKLVEQREEDGNAEDLYAQIQAEKQRLIAEKKIKKQKPLPEITDEEKPFEIPATWKWVRLDDIVIKTIKRGKSPTYTEKSNVLVFAQKCNTKAGAIDLSIAKYLDESKLSKYPVEEFMVNGDIVLNSTGNGTLGRVGLYRDTDNPTGLRLVPDSHVTVIRINAHISIEFVFYCLKYYQPYLEKRGSGSTNQTELSAEIVKNIMVPLPPIDEQKRIVEKLEQLLPLCERLK